MGRGERGGGVGGGDEGGKVGGRVGGWSETRNQKDAELREESNGGNQNSLRPKISELLTFKVSYSAFKFDIKVVLIYIVGTAMRKYAAVY